MADYKDYNHTQYRGGQIYPLQNPIAQGYGVNDPNIDPKNRQSNGMLVNQKNERIDFWIEEVSANFGMTGSTAQSRNVRQFFPHNVVQPSITVIGRAPNNHQYNRLSSFVRASHWNAFHPRALGNSLRHEVTPGGRTVQVQTVRLVIRNGQSANKFFPYNGGRNSSSQTVKGSHVPWVLEGYVKTMAAGAKRFDPAPQFKFEFFIAESKDRANLGIWEDTRVYGSELRPWLDWIKRDGGFVTVSDRDASKDTLDKNERGR